jgi:His/Glu/Gln/Arg/opine family amino acid ABC transporter permease subunit
METASLLVTGIVGSLPLGIVLALGLGRQSSMFAIKTMCVVFIEFIRGVPLITLLFVASVLLNYFLPPGTSFDLILRVVIMVTLFASAYMAEVIRGGLAALPSGQYEAADALWLPYAWDRPQPTNSQQIVRLLRETSPLTCFQSTVRAELACHGIVPADVLPAYKGDAMKFANLFFSLSVSASLHPFGWFTAIQASI